MSAGRVMIMAGGTGGHVFPALAVARALRERGVDVVWLGTRKGLEARVVPAAGVAMEWVSIAGLRGKGLGSWLLAPLRLFYALAQSMRIMARNRPGAVLGMGGFVSGPGGLAAWLLRRPLLVHEQNAIAGLTNRILARFAVAVLEGFPGSFPPARRACPVGNPVRAEILAVTPPAQRFAERSGPPRLLVIGGSQGALALNELLADAIASQDWREPPLVRHQAGAKTAEVARRAYANAGLDVLVEPFIEDMAGAYGWADLVVCRAGAITVAELAAAGVGAVLVPFPHAVDDHQTRNAEFLVQAGAAEMVQQHELDAVVLGRRLARLLPDRARLQGMAEAARRQAMPQATQALTSACLEQLGEVTS